RRMGRHYGHHPACTGAPTGDGSRRGPAMGTPGRTDAQDSADDDPLREGWIRSPPCVSQSLRRVWIGAVTTPDPTPVPRSATTRDALESALAAAGMGTWHWDRTSGVVHWDTTLEALGGIEPGGFGGTFDAFLESVHPDDRDEVIAT